MPKMTLAERRYYEQKHAEHIERQRKMGVPEELLQAAVKLVPHRTLNNLE